MQEQSRRDRHDGSLTAVPNAKGETWIAKWYTADGRRLTRTVGPKRSKAQPHGLTPGQAEVELKRMRATAEAEAKTQKVEPRQHHTMRSVGDSLLAEMRSKQRRPATIDNMDSVLRVHVVPFFGSARVDQIDQERVESFVKALEAKKLAPKSIRNILVNLHALFEHAISKNWSTADNPAKRVPKPQKSTSDDVRFLDLEEVEALLRAVPDTDLGRVDRAMYLTAAMTGLRQGELFGLRWRDVDWTAHKVRVQQSYVRGVFQTPKSKKTRAVPLADRVAAELDLLYQQSKFKADEDLVFVHPETGTMLDRRKVSKRFKTAVTKGQVGAFEPVIDRRTGKPRKDKDGNTVMRSLLRFHDLRHTFATTMARGGDATMQDIQFWMGHADLKTTLIYADYKPDAREAQWVEQAFSADAVEQLQVDEPAATASDDPLDRIQRLADLHAAGALDEDEFRAAKAAVLAMLNA